MTNTLSGKKIVLGITGGVAAYKSADLVRQLVKAGVEVTCVMTQAATHFIGVATMQALSGRPVYIDQWDQRVPNHMAHIHLSREADAILIAPCSTDFMAKLAHGLADDLLSTLCIARNCPLFIAPAMNREMWLNPATVRNAKQLQDDGIRLFGPASGEQACGETGLGRMLEPDQLLCALEHALSPHPLQGKHILLTAGPTIEPIDPVRVISNRSSGKMGYELAYQAYLLGATVTLVSGPTALACPYGVERISVETAQQMLDTVMDHVKLADVFIAVAAVADWKVSTVSSHKIKKRDAQDTPQLSFITNPDILAEVAALASAPYCVGFAAETHDLNTHGQTKRLKKRIPLLVGNIAQDTFGQDEVAFTYFDDQGIHPQTKTSKTHAAQQLLTEIARRLPISNTL